MVLLHRSYVKTYDTIHKDKKNKRSTMAGTFNTTFVTEKILKLPELNHSVEIYAKCHDNFILGRDILHKLEKFSTLKIKKLPA